MLRAHLERDNADRYDLLQIQSLEELRCLNLSKVCNVILLDMRATREHSLAIIRYVSKLQVNVALIALCHNHEQLQHYKDVIQHLDDYILAEHLVDGELPIRITHAIRRRHKEQALLQEKARLQSLLDAIPDAIFFKDRNSRFTKVNRRMETIYGQCYESIIGKTDFDLFAKEHAQEAFNDEQEILRTGEPLIGKLEKETFEDGHFNWVNTTKVALRDEQQSIIGTMGISRDITELKKAQDTLAQERSMLKTIIEHALAGIFVKDLAGHYLVVNRRHAKYLGAQSEVEVIGKTLYDFFEQQEAKRISSMDAQIMASEHGIENMVDYRQRTDGTELWLLTNKVPLRDDSGHCIGLVGISLDITQQKLAERKLKTTIQTLEATKLQLIEAEKLKTVGRLAAGVAHEVKNPLSVVSLGAEYLEHQIDGPEEMLQIIRDMRAAVQKANQVIFELLDYSSPHKIDMEPANINEIILRVLGLMRHNFNEACIKVQEVLSDEIEPVRLDASKMEQVFINLFLNAISVMQKGGELTIRTNSMQVKSAGSNVSSAMTELFRIGDRVVVIEVLDTGQGLNKDALSKAFEPFYSTKATNEGTGLGLSVTRSIIEMHHGMITLQNRKEKPGACVRIVLPAATDND
ncbi:PAS domain S-box protein [Coraliomargarita sp. SDUM461004]|uniref:histidine kinase n=1 Tax=Thalassobacterium sedimentorum TaxID=3041258 RepID=A0ABU1AHR2_9BACT|nr:PAS domain-containing protein [Coraliomargarita sp. SDUM461004]MDQ8193178.1 PAS domain S-box protein [Coraliomargarita sp. SDUM461004]